MIFKIIMFFLLILNLVSLVRLLRIDQDMKRLRFPIPSVSFWGKILSSFGVALCVWSIIL